MFQPFREKSLIIDTSEKIEIDSMEFYIKRIWPLLNEEFGDIEILLFGSEPNATTLYHQRVVKYEDLIWRPIRKSLQIFTVYDQHYDEALMSKDDAVQFMEAFKEKDDEIATIWLTLTTQVNEQRSYFWD